MSRLIQAAEFAYQLVRPVSLQSTSWHIYRGAAPLRFLSLQLGSTAFRAINNNEGSWTQKVTKINENGLKKKNKNKNCE